MGFCAIIVHVCRMTPRQSFPIGILFQAVFLGIIVFRHGCGNEARISQSLLGNRVPACPSKRLTARNARYHQDRAHEKASLSVCLNGICRAGGRKPTGRLPFERREKLSIESDEPDTKILHASPIRNISSFPKPRLSSLSTSVDFAPRIPFLGLTTTRYPVFSSGSIAR